MSTTIWNHGGTPPTKEGYYWIRRVGQPDSVALEKIVALSARDQQRVFLCVETNHEWKNYVPWAEHRFSQTQLEWLGPIEVPS